MRFAALLVAALALAAGCAREDAVVARPALWRASDGDTTVWLLGTIHLLPEGVEWQGGPVGRAIAEADLLITEIPEGDPQVQAAAFLKAARASGLPPLAQRVPRGEREALTAAASRAGIAVPTLDRMATWGAALALATGSARGVGATREDAVEAVLARAFAGRPQVSLETFEGQLGIFASLPEEAQRQLLSRTITDATDPEVAYRRTFDAWATGDVGAILAEFERAFAGEPALREALVTRRNADWAGQIAAAMARPGTVLIAVGAGHLAGPGGVPGLLARRGVRVERVQ